MSFNKDHKDLELLTFNPHQLVLQYQDLIEKIINLFIRSGNFRFQERNEIKQQINEELLKRLPKIQSQFQGKSTLKTYITVIIRNLCKEIAKRKNRISFANLEESLTNETTYSSMDFLVIEDEMRRLKKALSMYDKNEIKLILCLKLKFRLPFCIFDFKQLYKNFTFYDYNDLVQNIQPYKDASDLSIFSALTVIFNKYENKDNTPDALRKWISMKMEELVKLLNGNPPSHFYNEESFQILFEKCFFNEMEMNSKIG